MTDGETSGTFILPEATLLERKLLFGSLGSHVESGRFYIEGRIVVSGRRIRGFVTVTLLCLLGGAAAGSLSQTTASDNLEGEGNDPSLHESIKAIGSTVTSKWPHEYGWVWIEPDKPEDGVFVGFTEGAEEKVAELAKDFSYPELLVPVTVKYSATEIQDLQNQIIAGRENAKRGEGLCVTFQTGSLT